MKWILLCFLFIQLSVFASERLIIVNPILNLEGVTDEGAKRVTENIVKFIKTPENKIAVSGKKGFKSFADLKQISTENKADIVITGTIRNIDSNYYLFLYKYINGEKEMNDFTIECDDAECKYDFEDQMAEKILSLPKDYTYVEPIPESNLPSKKIKNIKASKKTSTKTLKKEESKEVIEKNPPQEKTEAKLTPDETIQKGSDRFLLIYRSVLMPGWGQAAEKKRTKGMLLFFGMGFILSFVEKFIDDIALIEKEQKRLVAYSFLFSNQNISYVNYSAYQFFEAQKKVAETKLNYSESLAIFFYSMNIIDIAFNEKDIEKRFLVNSNFKKEKISQGGIDEVFQIKFQLSY